MPRYATSTTRPELRSWPAGTVPEENTSRSGRRIAGPRSVADDVGGPDEGRDEARRGLVVHLDRVPDLLDAAVAEDGQAVAHRERLLLVVRHVHERDAHLALDPLQLDLHLLAELEVERPERLVEQEHLGLVDDRAGQRHALALAPGELGGLARLTARRGAPSRASRRPATAARPCRRG